MKLLFSPEPPASAAAGGAEGEEAWSPSRGRGRRGDLQEVPDDAAHGLHPARHAAVRRKPRRHGQQVTIATLTHTDIICI